MTILTKILREPLTHFVLIGAAVFGLYALVAGGVGDTRDTIVVTEGRVQQRAQVFAKTWQRQPTPEELRGLVDAYVKEEVYYREALKLGLDRDDTLIRRRMQQKMEFVTEPGDSLLAADDATLQAFLDANKSDFRVNRRSPSSRCSSTSKKRGVGALAGGASPRDLERFDARQAPSRYRRSDAAAVTVAAYPTEQRCSPFRREEKRAVASQ